MPTYRGQWNITKYTRQRTYWVTATLRASCMRGDIPRGVEKGAGSNALKKLKGTAFVFELFIMCV